MAKTAQPLLESVTQNPLLVEQTRQQLFQSSIQHVVSHEHAVELLDNAASASASEDEDFWPNADDWRAAYRPYNVKDGVLQIPVMGVLLSRFPYQLGRWATGYKYIEKALERGLSDGNVRGIAFIHDSPGGEVRECFECSDKIYEARGEKPMVAFVADHSYSASFALSCAADEIVITRSGGVGSVGVVTAHVDMSKALEDYGVKVTFIFAGKHKVDGNPYEKLPDDVKSRIQERIDRIYGVFTSTVARNRNMDDDAVRATEALTYDAEESIDIGFADRVGKLEDEMAVFAEQIAEAEEEQMATNTKPEVTTDAVDKAAHDKAVADARAEGAKANQDRIKAILGSDEAKSRPKAAMATAMNTDMSAEAAKEFLAALPEEKVEAPAPSGEEAGKGTTEANGKKGPAAAGATPFEQAMDKNNPEVGADAGKEGENDDADEAASILSSYAGVAGFQRKGGHA